MRPSDKRKKFILDYLTKAQSEVNLASLKDLIDKARQAGFTENQIFEEVDNMGSNNDGLLTSEIVHGFGGGGTLVAHKDYWITDKGEDYLYNLEHPEEGGFFNVSTFNIENQNNNGPTIFGDHASLSDDHSSTVDIDNSIHQLIKLKPELPDSVDPHQLDELAVLLKQMIAGQVKPEPGALKKFGNFLDKTWKVISPVAAPLIVAAFKPIIF